MLLRADQRELQDKQRQRLADAERTLQAKSTFAATENRRIAGDKIVATIRRIWEDGRRDNLEGFWKGQFGHTHGILVVNAFFENVNRHKAEGRELADGEPVQNRVLEFRPNPPRTCRWRTCGLGGQLAA